MTENWETRWKDYYKILQIDFSAEPEVVKGAYDKLVRKYHPDINKNPKASSQMYDINEAFEVLGDPLKRRQYHIEWQKRKPGLATKYRKRLNFKPLFLLVLVESRQVYCPGM
jgi:DnaJ-class molecular chaperone